MKVATRITVATAVVVLLASATYAYFDLRGRWSERRNALEREARAVATTLRMGLEGSASAFRPPNDAQLKLLGGWRASVIVRERANEPAGSDASKGQLSRLGLLLDVPTLCGGAVNPCAAVEGDDYYYDLPLRSSEQTVLGMLEIRHSADVLSVTRDDLARAA